MLNSPGETVEGHIGRVIRAYGPEAVLINMQITGRRHGRHVGHLTRALCWKQRSCERRRDKRDADCTIRRLFDHTQRVAAPGRGDCT